MTMTAKNNLTTHPIQPALLAKRMVLGAGIALLLITIFLLGVDDPKPEWGKLWMIKPLIIVPLAGAMGGVVYHVMDYLRQQGKLPKAVAYLLSLIGYVIGLWLGTVLGLNGTLWD
jgi:peptidoglycan biosynthesis protein MviN/MurJ (putative lipid II flippase)